MNRYVKPIACRVQKVMLHRGSPLPMLKQSVGFLPESAKRLREDDKSPPAVPDLFEGEKSKDGARRTPSASHTEGVAKSVNIPAMSQMAVRVVSSAGGIVYLEPKNPMMEQHRDRAANGIADIHPDMPLDVGVVNFSRESGSFPKGMVLPCAKRNPLGVYMVDSKTSKELEDAFQLPFETIDVPNLGLAKAKPSPTPTVA